MKNTLHLSALIITISTIATGLIFIVPVKAGENFSSSRTYTSTIYFPLIKRSIPEIDIPSRWFHDSGQPVNITYKWVDELENPYHTWRIAFQQGINDWDNSGTLVHLYYHSGSSNFIDMDYDYTEDPGFTLWYDVGGDGITDYVQVYGNLYWDIHLGFSNNQRLSTSSHEIGHLLCLGHIPRTEPAALMWEWFYLDETEMIFSPQPIDIGLANQVYP